MSLDKIKPPLLSTGITTMWGEVGVEDFGFGLKLYSTIIYFVFQCNIIRISFR